MKYPQFRRILYILGRTSKYTMNFTHQNWWYTKKHQKKVSMRQDFNYASIDIGNRVANEGLLQ
jgi:hypothetical protein